MPSMNVTATMSMTEIGHTFGLRHNGVSNRCDQRGHIMSPGRSEEAGETRWSKCAVDKLKAFNKGCVYDEPNFDVFTDDGKPSR